MFRTGTVVIGGGQAGLAVSRELTEYGLDHVIVEQGRVGQRWRSERWDSLRLLTPNWMTRLPHFAYDGDDPDGFMRAAEVAEFFERYAASYDAPVLEETHVERLERAGEGFRVTTDRAVLHAGAVVIATGQADAPYVPPVAAQFDARLEHVVPTAYKRPGDLAGGGVLVVGASATGVQLAEELAHAGRDVVLAVGSHTRAVRRYRGRDLYFWLDRCGVLATPIDAMADPTAARRQPSLQLVGRAAGPAVDLPALHEAGVTIAGRLAAAHGRLAFFRDDLRHTTAESDTRLRRLLARIDEHIDSCGIGDAVPAAEPVPEVVLPPAPMAVDLVGRGIRTVVWATGYRRSVPWLHLPVLDEHGEIVQRAGATAVPGCHVVGARFQTRRDSSFIDGVRHDAAIVARRIAADAGARTRLAV
jgi:putative flavoprotein involved in K+ transport